LLSGSQSTALSEPRHDYPRLETVDLDGLGIQLQPFLIGQKLLHILALIALQLDHLAHLRVVDNGAIAGELLLDHLEDLLLVELLRQALDGGQGFATIALLDTDVNVVGGLFGLSCIRIGLGKGVESLQVLDISGHKTALWSWNRRL